MNALKLSMLLLIPVFALSACGGSDDDNLDDRADLADPKVRFVHAVPGGPEMTLFRGGVPQGYASGVGYKFASQYAGVSTSTETWSVSTSGSNPVELVSLSLDARRGNKYSIVAVPAADVVDALLIDDPYNKGLTSDRARVRVLNASVNAQDVDVYLTDPAVDLASVQPDFPALQFKTTQPPSGSDSREYAGGTYQLRITAAGTKVVIFTAPVALENNADWLLLSIPEGGLGAFVPGEIKVLVAKSDDSSQTTLEIESQ